MTSLSHRVRSKQPYCVYCGGVEIGNSLDHVPPISLFDGRRRPKWGEVTACVSCHEGTRDIDAIASFLSRAYPNPTTVEQRKDIEKALDGIIRRFPKLVAELGTPSSGGPLDEGGGLLGTGPIINSVMLHFGARIAYALHYNITGSFVPPRGGAVVLWYSNVHLFEKELPDEFLAHLGPEYTLKQGRQTAGDQFSFSWVLSTDDSLHGYWASFRRSFALAMFVSPTRRDLHRFNRNLFTPGFLKGYSVNAVTVFDWFSTEGVGVGRLAGMDDN